MESFALFSLLPAFKSRPFRKLADVVKHWRQCHRAVASCNAGPGIGVGMMYERTGKMNTRTFHQVLHHTVLAQTKTGALSHMQILSEAEEGPESLQGARIGDGSH